jgi:hypothetical protein
LLTAKLKIFLQRAKLQKVFADLVKFFFIFLESPLGVGTLQHNFNTTSTKNRNVSTNQKPPPTSTPSNFNPLQLQPPPTSTLKKKLFFLTFQVQFFFTEGRRR